MDVGVFISFGNKGWIASPTSPRSMPTFDPGRALVESAEHHRLAFALSLIELDGATRARRRSEEPSP
jgi:hypothetical protein